MPFSDDLQWNGGTGASAMSASRQEMKVNGKCLSACALSFATNPKACWGVNALLGFHSPYDPGTGQAMPGAAQWWDEKLKETAPALQTYIGPLSKHHGRLPNGKEDMAYVTAQELQWLMPEKKCK